MRTQRTFLRRDLYRLVYKYSHPARQEGLDLEYAFGDLRRKGEYKNKALRNGYFKRCLFNYIQIKWDKSLYYLDEENKRFIKAKETNYETGIRHTEP